MTLECAISGGIRKGTHPLQFIPEPACAFTAVRRYMTGVPSHYIADTAAITAPHPDIGDTPSGMTATDGDNPAPPSD